MFPISHDTSGPPAARRLAWHARAPFVLATFAALLLASCATTGYQSTTTNMPIERSALRPEYRVFYDALQEDGDWTLIEPYGYVFRPDVNFVAWSPYEQGFWVPSDAYGWVWISTEPFGWATYHYGRWMYDAFQGWVWIPGNEWAPAWVSWEMAGPYIGWSPIIGAGVNLANIPGGGWRYAPMAAMATTDLRTRLVTPAQMGDALAEARPIQNFAEVQGVKINRGPDIALVERTTGPLQRVKITEPAPTGRPGKRDVAPETPAAPADDPATLRRAGEEAARTAGGIAKVGAAPPAAIPLVRAPTAKAAAETPEKRPGRSRKVTAPDTTASR